ncbi:MAG: ABC transporter permease [Anaerolineae bacterium]|nr:ABC transporter permease [Anaerolineae bacterium]
MIGRMLRLFWRQMNVQLQIRTFNLYTLLLLFVQPFVFSAVGMVLSQVAGNQKPDLVYTVIGGGILGMWSGLVFSSTFDIGRDRRDGTLEFIIGSPTPYSVVEAVRTLTNVLTGLVSLLAAFLVAVLVFDYTLDQVQVLPALVSLLLIVAGMWAIGVFLANFLVWSRLSGSIVEFFEFPVAVVCGFMYPIRILPEWMQAISAVFPIRWALEGLQAALYGVSDMNFYAGRWGMALALGLLFWLTAHWMERKVHDLIRVSGEMSSI